MARIGIDLDNVLCPTVKTYMDYINRKYNINLKFNEWYSEQSLDLFKSLNKFKNTTIKERLDEFRAFIYTDSCNNMLPIDNSVAVLTRLSRKHELFVITARHESLKGATQDWLYKNFKNIFKEVKHVKYSKQDTIKKGKPEICEDLKIDLLIDDSLRSTISCAKKNISSYLFDLGYNWNKSKNLPTLIKRVHSWKEVEEKIKKKY